jgi:hypothetical protein
VADRPVAKQWFWKQRPFLGNSSVNAFPRQRIHTQQWSYCWKRGASKCSMLICYKKETKSVLGSSVWEAVKRRFYAWYLECVIQWDCYKSCFKIRCQETASGDCNRLRTLVCVCQWSVKCSHESWVYKWSINRVNNEMPVYSHPYTWQYTYIGTKIIML